MAVAFEAACQDWGAPTQSEQIFFASRIMNAVKAGERDPAKRKLLALQGLVGHETATAPAHTAPADFSTEIILDHVA